MKVILQNVLNASVSINGNIYSSINRGFLLLVGFSSFDNEEIIKKMALKISKLRVFEDQNKKTNLSLKDVDGEILSVSQFTLYGSVLEGNRPSFIKALNPKEASKFYDIFNDELKNLSLKVKTGIFQTDMKVSLVNDGPFTLILDSEELFK